MSATRTDLLAAIAAVRAAAKKLEDAIVAGVDFQMEVDELKSIETGLTAATPPQV